MSTEAPSELVQPTPELGILPKQLRPNIDHIVTEDDTPVDNIFSEKQQRLLADSLYNSWKPDEPFVAMTNVGLFYAVKKPPFVPDMLVSKGVEVPKDPFPKENRSYFVWEYGKAPDVVIEIVSNLEGGEDSIKLKGYAQIGIPFYVIFDPDMRIDGRVLRVFRLDGRKYQLQSNDYTYLDSIGLGVTLWPGTFEGLEATWLRWASTDGELLLTGNENTVLEKEKTDAEKSRADAEKSRAEAEKSRAEAAELQNERLIAQLQKLGIEPEI